MNYGIDKLVADLAALGLYPPSPVSGMATYAIATPLPGSDVGPIYSELFASVMTWRTIGAYTGYASVDIGKIVPFAANSAAQGYTLADGAVLAVATVNNPLIAYLGTATKPDLRGEFIRGLDNGRGVDAGRANLSAQGHQFQTHEHIVSNRYDQAGNSADGSRYAGVNGTQISVGNKVTLGIVAGANSGAETRPRSIAAAYFIKL